MSSIDTFRARRTPGARTIAMAAAAAGCVLATGLALAGCGSAASSGSSTPATTAASTATATSTAPATTPTASSSSSGVVSLASVPFPVAQGNTWKFKITTAAGDGTTVSTMSSVVPVAAGQQVTMTSTNDILGTTTTNSSTYVFESDGSIVYPLSENEVSSGVSVSGSGVVWPSAAVIDSGKPSTSDLKLTIKADGETIDTTAHITVQGAGTQTVTVPAGTYTATVVDMTEAFSIEGITASIEIKTWLAPGVGPVKDEVLTNDAGASAVSASEELESFTKG